MCRALGVNRTSFHDWERRAPSDRALSDAFLIEKAIYELEYELNNRPAWAEIPLRGLMELMEKSQ